MSSSGSSGNISNTANPIIVVQGGFWGSESKGAICAALGHIEQADIMVRTGTVNAGHTVYYNGFPFAMQQLPVGWTNPKTVLYLGPGAYIHPEILAREIAWINKATGTDVRSRLYIDYRCGLHLPSHTMKAKSADRHHKMGATGKGCSEAVVDKIAGRGTARGRLFKQWLDESRESVQFEHEELLLGLEFEDVPALLNSSWDEGAKVIIEGTQGTLLDLHLGPYPYTTHKQTQAASWIAECGLSPALPYEIVSVVRTYPIRVAGNSGPMPREIGWPDLARKINRRLAERGLPPRVQEDSIRQFEAACREVAADFIQFMGIGERELLGDWGAGVKPADLWKIENWTQGTREASPNLQEYVSELHAKALNLLPGSVVEDLRHLFELTTVTKKLRRIAELDESLLRYSCMLNRPAYLALTFINYMFPETWGMTRWADMSIDTMGLILNMCQQLETRTGCPIRYISTGPETKHILDVREVRSTAQALPVERNVTFKHIPADLASS